MPTVDMRHAEKTHLFSLYIAQITGDIKTQILSLEASMEEDVKQVQKKVEEWKEKSNLQ